MEFSFVLTASGQCTFISVFIDAFNQYVSVCKSINNVSHVRICLDSFDLPFSYHYYPIELSESKATSRTKIYLRSTRII